MKSHDQETKTLFAMAVIAIALLSGYTVLSKLYQHLFGENPVGFLIVALVLLHWWIHALSWRFDSFEKRMKDQIDAKLDEFSQRLREREKEVSWLRHSESRAKEERAQLQRWVEALSNDVRQFKTSHKRQPVAPAAAIEEAIREIATEGTE
jgi:hypothetical protein